MKISKYMRGIAVCGLIGGFAILWSESHQGPVMLMAIVLGLVMHFLADIEELQPGINWCSKSLLYIGVALLGLRIDVSDLAQAGYLIPAIIIFALISTIFFGVVSSKLLGLSKRFSILIGGAVAICGISAAAAICAAMGDDEDRDNEMAITVAGITVLSTLAMLFYPVVAQYLDLGETAAGVLMGGSIHNVSQAVGAGLVISDYAGEMAVLSKLLRVSMLLPVVFLIAVFLGQKSTVSDPSFRQKIKAGFPPFLIVFIGLAVLSCLHLVPSTVTTTGKSLSNIALVVSLVAIGIKTDMKQVLNVGIKPLIAMTITSLGMVVIVLLGIYALGIA